MVRAQSIDSAWELSTSTSYFTPSWTISPAARPCRAARSPRASSRPAAISGCAADADPQRLDVADRVPPALLRAGAAEEYVVDDHPAAGPAHRDDPGDPGRVQLPERAARPTTSPSGPISIPPPLPIAAGSASTKSSTLNASQGSGSTACRHRTIPVFPELDPPLMTINRAVTAARLVSRYPLRVLDWSSSRRASREERQRAELDAAPSAGTRGRSPRRPRQRPSVGWITTPPAEPSRLSDDSTVARCADGIWLFRYACRTGDIAANISPHHQQHSATQNDVTTPITAITTVPATVAIRIRSGRPEQPRDVRRRRAAGDLRTGHDPGRQTGDRVRVLVPYSSSRYGCAA